MKRTFLYWSCASVFLMMLVPWIIVSLAPHDAGMALCFILFYAVNPLYAFLIGFAAGKNCRELWPLPIISSGLFLAGTSLFFEPSEPAFLTYAIRYVLIGIIAMLIRSVIQRRKKDKA